MTPSEAPAHYLKPIPTRPYCCTAPPNPPSPPGNSYAVQVQAVEADGKDLFINNGNSEVVKFTYGEKCSPPLNVQAQLADANSLKLSWTALPLQQAFSIRYREANNNTAEWFEQETYTTNYTARGLRPGHTYEYQVKAECGTGYGEYTPLQQFQSPMKSSGRVILYAEHQ